MRQIADALVPWDEAAFQAHFDLAAMQKDEVYPVMADEDGETLFEYAWENFEQLKAFYQKAAGRGYCVLAFII